MEGAWGAPASLQVVVPKARHEKRVINTPLSQGGKRWIAVKITLFDIRTIALSWD